MYDNEDERFALRFRNDIGIGSVGALVIEIAGENPENPFADYVLSGLLVATWRKDRGATDSMGWAVQRHGFDSDDGRGLTRAQAQQIVALLDARGTEES